jgi:hypothetical protein
MIFFPQVTLSTSGATNVAPIDSQALLSVQLTGTWVATIAFEVSPDGTNWYSAVAYPNGGGAAVGSATANGLWLIPIAGLSQFRVRVSAYTSGSATVNMGATTYLQIPQATATATADGAAAAGLQEFVEGLWNGATVDRAKSASAANLAAKSGVGASVSALPGMWPATHAPAVNTQASASQAAGGAGVRHVCTGISINLAAGGTAPAATQLTVNLRDGATGAGSILATWTIAIPATAGAFAAINLTGLNIPGTANTAMTLEFTAAGGPNTYESCTLFGYDTQ